MHLLRIKLENWRGVEAAEIKLDKGITIVEGDNEAGKSSFIEALNLLFRERDTTKKQELKRVTPKGVDAGSVVEVEFTTGPYHLTYSKTFNKKTATTLFIHKPVSRQLVGTEAHERVVQLLDETIDFNLWQAIQLEQGGEFTQVSFRNSDSLAAALDNAAGGSGAGDGESVLLEKAKREYLKYFTERTAKATGELAALRAQEQTLKESGTQLQGALAQLDAYVEDSARLSTGLAELLERVPSMQVKLARLETKRAEFATLQQRLSTSEAEVASCELQLKEIERQIAQRDELIKEQDALKKTIEADGKNKSVVELSHTRASSALEAVTVERDSLLSSRQKAEQQLKSVEALVEQDARKVQLKQLELQHQQLQTKHRELTALEKELSGYRVDDVAINRIEKLEQQRRDQEIQISGHSAKISFEFLTDTRVDDGADHRQYRAGQELVTDSSKATTLLLNDALRVRIDPAADHYELTIEYQKTIAALNDLLSACGVKSPVEATASYRKRSELTARLREMKRNYDALTKEQDIDELARTIEDHRQVISMAISVAKSTTHGESVDNAETAQLLCRQQLEELEESIVSARERREQALQHATDTRIRLDVCVETISVNKQQLDKVEQKAAVLESSHKADELKVQRLNACETLKRARDAQAKIQTELQQSSADGIDLLVDNARQSLHRAQSEIRELELQQADVKARLDQMQAEGLHEKLESVRAEHEDNAARLRQLDRRSQAAARLWTTLSQHQRQAQLSYARPLAERVASMGRIIFGEDFAVELDDSLTIVSRTLDGRTVPFDDLSGGAREQLGILLRLAAAQLVSKTEAMPLIFDDALGHTDARRLETMGAILNSAAQTSQIVVMTCYPARYSYVGSAKIVRLRQQQDSLFEAG